MVSIGGMIGAAARYAAGLAWPTVAGNFPWTTFAINVVGAFALGWLLAGLSRGPDQGMRRVVRLFVGTGILGGFTTYSALAADTAQLFGAGDGWLAAAYALGTVVVGLGATVAGILLAPRMRTETAR